jgi:hypothetical protein
MKAHFTGAYWFMLMLVSSSMIAMAGSDFRSGPGLHSAMPAGYEVVQLKPSGANLFLMGLIECPELEGAQQVPEGTKSRLLGADGQGVARFPHQFSFRITASLRKVVLDGPVASVNVPDDPQEMLLKLRFRVKAYNGLEMREITPESIDLIGMPADVPYDERVYRVTVKIGDTPITDRFVIEILSPEGELLTHFPFSVL